MSFLIASCRFPINCTQHELMTIGVFESNKVQHSWVKKCDYVFVYGKCDGGLCSQMIGILGLIEKCTGDIPSLQSYRSKRRKKNR